MRVSVLTISDSVAAGTTEDRSGPSVIARCRELGWRIVSSAVRADDRAAIEIFLKEAADSNDASTCVRLERRSFHARCFRVEPREFAERPSSSICLAARRALWSRSTPSLICFLTPSRSCTARATSLSSEAWRHVQNRLGLRYTPFSLGAFIVTFGNNQPFQSEEKSE